MKGFDLWESCVQEIRLYIKIRIWSCDFSFCQFTSSPKNNKALVVRDATTWNIQEEVRRFERWPFVWKLVVDDEPSLEVFSLHFSGICISTKGSFVIIGTTSTGTDRRYYITKNDEWLRTLFGSYSVSIFIKFSRNSLIECYLVNILKYDVNIYMYIHALHCLGKGKLVDAWNSTCQSNNFFLCYIELP